LKTGYSEMLQQTPRQGPRPSPCWSCQM